MAPSVDFSKKKCGPCEGTGRAMTANEASDYLKSYPNWNLASDGKSIDRKYVLKNFVEAVNLIDTIKDIAESEGHHPDLHLTGYKNLQVVLYTHALGGITENDLIVAAKIDQIK